MGLLPSISASGLVAFRECSPRVLSIFYKVWWIFHHAIGRRLYTTAPPGIQMRHQLLVIYGWPQSPRRFKRTAVVHQHRWSMGPAILGRNAKNISDLSRIDSDHCVRGRESRHILNTRSRSSLLGPDHVKGNENGTALDWPFPAVVDFPQRYQSGLIRHTVLLPFANSWKCTVSIL